MQMDASAPFGACRALQIRLRLGRADTPRGQGVHGAFFDDLHLPCLVEPSDTSSDGWKGSAVDGSGIGLGTEEE